MVCFTASFLDLPCTLVVKMYDDKVLGNVTVSWEDCGLEFSEPSEGMTWIQKQKWAAFLGNKPYLSFHFSAGRGNINAVVGRIHRPSAH